VPVTSADPQTSLGDLCHLMQCKCHGTLVLLIQCKCCVHLVLYCLGKNDKGEKSDTKWTETHGYGEPKSQLYLNGIEDSGAQVVKRHRCGTGWPQRES
jgi:hypothetical protein